MQLAMTRTGSVGVLAMFLAAAADVGVEACSASTVVDAARRAGDSEAYRLATDVAREVLDREGIRNQDVARTVSDNAGTVTATPLEGAAATLVVEAGNKGIGITRSDANFGGVTTGGVSIDRLRQLLDERSDYSIHVADELAGGFTVRSHMLVHARDYGATGSSTAAARAPAYTPVPTAPPVSASPSVPTTPPTPATAPIAPAVPPVYHAG